MPMHLSQFCGADRPPAAKGGLTGRGFSDTCQGGHRPRYSTTADACYWLPLPGERAGVRGQRHREPSQVESPDALLLAPLPEEKELVFGSATALTPAIVSRAESFVQAPVLLQSTPHPSPLPKEREPVVTKTTPSLAKGGFARGGNWSARQNNRNPRSATSNGLA